MPDNSEPIDPNTNQNAPFRYREDVLALLSEPTLEQIGIADNCSPEQKCVAFALAVAVGKCRIFNVSLGDEYDGVLPVYFAVAAAEEFLTQIERFKQALLYLENRWDGTDDIVEGDMLCASILSARMDLWADFLAIDESFQSALCSCDPACAKLRPVMRDIIAGCAEIDKSLRSKPNAEILSTISETELLNNWRYRLARRYSHPLPWWLNGVFEQQAAQLRNQSSTTQPFSLIPKAFLSPHSPHPGDQWSALIDICDPDVIDPTITLHVIVEYEEGTLRFSITDKLPAGYELHITLIVNSADVGLLQPKQSKSGRREWSKECRRPMPGDELQLSLLYDDGEATIASLVFRGIT